MLIVIYNHTQISASSNENRWHIWTGLGATGKIPGWAVGFWGAVVRYQAGRKSKSSRMQPTQLDDNPPADGLVL